MLLSTSEDTLLIVLETISSVLRIDDASWLDTELANALVLAILQVWNKNIKGGCEFSSLLLIFNTYFKQDPIFISILTDIMSLLASSLSNGVNEIVVKQAVPVLTNALASAKPIESWITSSAIDLLNSIVEGRVDGLQSTSFATYRSIFRSYILEWHKMPDKHHPKGLQPDCGLARRDWSFWTGLCSYVHRKDLR